MGKVNFNDFFRALIKKVKERYIYLIILTVITTFFTLFYKEMICRESFEPNKAEAENVLNNVITQDINIEYNNPQYIGVKVGSTNSNVSKIYNINIFLDDESISEVDVDTSKLGKEEMLSLILPKLDNIKGKSLKLQIKSEKSNASEDSSLIIYTNTLKNETNSMSIDGVESNKIMYTMVAYNKFTAFYLTFVILLYISVSILILFIDVKKIHNSVCAVILVVGSFCVLLNPVLDTPDDHAHLSRADLTSRGILFVSGDTSKYSVSNSVWDILQDNYSTLETTQLFNSKIDNATEHSFSNYANTNLFLGYIPQTIGLIIGKTFGKLIGTGSILLMILGRLMNLIVYAVMIRLAIKITPVFKIPMSIIALMPMSIFIASSFNPDATTYWLAMILIAYFLSIYNKEDIDIKDIAIFTCISILLGLVKLPYSALGGLIIFIPKEKFKSKKIYYKSFLFVCIIALVCLTWGVSAMLKSGGSSPFDSFYAKNNIDTNAQITYILNNPTSFIKNFSKVLVDNSRSYMDQLNVFGWLSYGLSSGVSQLYVLFLGAVILLYPNEYVLSKKTKYGVIITGFTVYAVTCLVLYLSWTPVGSQYLDGVQGRYFVPLLALASSLSVGKVDDEEKRNYDINTKFIVTAIIFIVIFIITLMNKYY